VKAGAGRGGLAIRLLRAACPGGERRWVDALLAEEAWLEPAQRPAWRRGILRTVAVANLRRLGGLPAARRAAIGAGLLAVIASPPALTGSEALGLDDDVFIAAAVWGAAAATTLALRPRFRPPRARGS